MKKQTFIIGCISILLGFTASESRGQNASPAIQQGTATHYLKSKLNNKTYELSVSLPAKYSPSDSLRYPVLYVLDGKYSFAVFQSIQKLMELGREIKDIIIVAIDDSCGTKEAWLTSRHSDYTPSRNPQADTIWTQILNLPKGSLVSGGAGTFLSVLKKELIPYIETNYKASPDRGLYGHSLGGLFVTYCMLTDPALFKRYSANSPSVWWNNNEMLSTEQKFAATNPALPANIFISVGALEDEKMTGPVVDLMEAVKTHHYKGSKITSQVFEGENHLSVVPACSTRTLKVLYGIFTK